MSTWSDIFGDGFNADEHEPTTDYSLLPAGDYIVDIEEAELRPTKAGDGHYLWLAHTVAEGEFAGRKLWKMINVDNPNTKTVEWAQSELSALCRSVGIHNLPQFEELIGQRTCACVKVKRPKKGQEGEPQNEIRTYKPIEQAGQQAKAPAQPPKSDGGEQAGEAASQAAEGDEKAPWE